MRRDVTEQYGVPDGRIVTIPNGVDAERFHPARRAAERAEQRRALGLDGAELALLFVASGNFENRGLPTLLEAFARRPLPAARLLVAGGDRAERFRRLAAERGLEQRVQFLPFAERIEALHAAADALVFPSHYDTFGNVPLEAMASGLPVVVTAQCGMTELLTDGADSLIVKQAGDAEALAAALARLADPALRARLGAQARATAERHSWDRVAERMLALYEELVQPP
jgi:UDP-glucose:(heptosyl)LPS alpha-1,3-glucosyltransferase